MNLKKKEGWEPESLEKILWSWYERCAYRCYISSPKSCFIVCCQDINIKWLIEVALFVGIQRQREEANFKLWPFIAQAYCTDSETFIIKQYLWYPIKSSHSYKVANDWEIIILHRYYYDRFKLTLTLTNKCVLLKLLKLFA